MADGIPPSDPSVNDLSGLSYRVPIDTCAALAPLTNPYSLRNLRSLRPSDEDSVNNVCTRDGVSSDDESGSDDVRLNLHPGPSTITLRA